MNRHAARVVELPEVLTLLRQWVPSPLGLSRLARLAPSHSARVVRARLARTREAMSIRAAGEAIPLESLMDPLPLLRRASAGSVLAGEELFALGVYVTECVRVRDFFSTRTGECPHLHALLEGIPSSFWDGLKELETSLRVSIGPAGEILDEASPRLRTLRAALHHVDSRVRDAAHQAVKDLVVREALQETVVHYRGGRPVLPVKSSLRDKVPGVLRDVSASGATLFVEPMEAARLGRQRERIRKELDKEERRIRRVLTQRIAASAADLQRMRGVIGRLEVAWAAAAFGLARNGVCAELSTDGTLDLRTVYHPLLPAGSVPLSIRLDGATRTILITGPNTGGKTVALKSVGLAVLMTACGVPVLGREGTTVPVVRAVLADIGDEQSIQQSLSTFSGHMANIVSVIGQVNESPSGYCLVLLDELGAGTDPAEGEALGCAILEWLHFAGGPRLRLLATSHFARLKELAAATDEMANARMEFDPGTLRPTYELSMGASGASQAFPVAQRLGLPGDILARAGEFLGPERIEFQRLVASLDVERTELQAARRRVEEQTRALEEERRASSAEAARRRAELEGMKQEFRRQAEEVLAWSRRQLKAARAAEGAASAQRRHVEIHGALRALSALAQEQEPAPCPVRHEELRAGDHVEVEGLGRGSCADLDRKNETASVLIGGVRAVVPLGRVRKVDGPAARPTTVVTLPEATVGPELLLVGMRADEARERVVRYLDDARAADLSAVRIVHGFGRGVLREIVRDALRSHPAVVKFRAGLPQEGGQGVTLVYLQ